MRVMKSPMTSTHVDVEMTTCKSISPNNNLLVLPVNQRHPISLQKAVANSLGQPRRSSMNDSMAIPNCLSSRTLLDSGVPYGSKLLQSIEYSIQDLERIKFCFG